MANNFFKNGDKVYAENLNDGVLVGNAFDWTVEVSLPADTGSVFPDSSSVVKAKVCDVSVTPNSNLSIGSTISNSSGSSQIYRLTVYPDFNRFGGFKSISLTGNGTFYIANKGASTPIANNLDYTNLGNVPELKVLKEYDIVVTIANNKTVTGLSFVLQSSSADVSGTISQSSVSGLGTALNGKANSSHTHGNILNDGTITTEETGNFIYFAGIGSTSNKVFKSSKLKATQIIDLPAHSNIGSSASADQATINTNIDTALGSKASSTHTHGNVSNDGKIGSASGKIITTTTNGALQASDSITKSQISDFPSEMTPSSHTHGNISNAGAIGTSSGKIITTTTNGVLQASSSITKSKISDFPSTMTPSSHTHGNVTNDGKIGSTSGYIVTTGTSGALQASATITKDKISDFSHTHGNVTNDGKIGSTSGKIITTGTNGALQASSTITKDKISDFAHNHDDRYYTETEVSAWEEVEVTGATDYATLYVNTALRLCHFRYYRTGYNFTSTSDVVLHSGAIPSNYRPANQSSIPCTCFNPNVGLVVSGSSGDISAVSISTGSKTINASGMWHY